MQKEIMGTYAKYYNYINRVFQTVCEYYNYDFIKLSQSDNGKETFYKIFKEKNLNQVKFYFSNNNESLKKEELGITVIGFAAPLIHTEAISLTYRFLEEIGFSDLLVKVNTNSNEILEHLNYLDVDYELNDQTEKKLEDNISMVFEIMSDNNEVLCQGEFDEKKEQIYSTIDLNLLMDLLPSISNLKEEKRIDVYVTSKSEEEKLTAIRLVQDLRWSEIITEMNYQEEEMEEQLKEANDLNARIIIKLNSEDLKKGLITVQDNLTKEETKVDENEILDYVISNL